MNKKHFTVLVGLVILFGLGSILANQCGMTWLDSFSSNISSGFLGALLTAWLIDRSLANEKRKDIERVSKVALNFIRPAISRHFGILIDWYIAATPEKPKSIPESITDIFNEDYYEQVLYLDFSKETATLEKSNWFSYTKNELEFFVDRISQVIDKYALFLDTEALVLLENLNQSNLVNMLITVGKVNMQAIDKKRGWSRTYNTLNVYAVDGKPSLVVQDHVEKLLAFLEYYNKNAQNPITVEQFGLWRENSALKFGSGRLDKQKENN